MSNRYLPIKHNNLYIRFTQGTFHFTQKYRISRFSCLLFCNLDMTIFHFTTLDMEEIYTARFYFTLTAA